MRKTHEVIISPMGIEVDSQKLELSNTGIKLLKEVYCTAIGNYPKFKFRKFNLLISDCKN